MVLLLFLQATASTNFDHGSSRHATQNALRAERKGSDALF